MKKDELKMRTKKFALRIIQLAEALPMSRAGNAIGNQLVRCGTSVAANYRAACRAKSVADFICKISMVEEEADETLFWLEMITDSGMMPLHRLQDLQREANELTAIFTAIGKTTKQKYGKKK
ncbi:four helix bundle protein [Rhodoflexus caldus]|uniref:four helix bundle protein n=1 Tax=Rhodoflexus caldus TaxID=2891236 RepID=UPI00202AA60C|nr:four helix bundle protein [Rhodoflexus caldus]